MDSVYRFIGNMLAIVVWGIGVAASLYYFLGYSYDISVAVGFGVGVLSGWISSLSSEVADLKEGIELLEFRVQELENSDTDWENYKDL